MDQKKKIVLFLSFINYIPLTLIYTIAKGRRKHWEETDLSMPFDITLATTFFFVIVLVPILYCVLGIKMVSKDPPMFHKNVLVFIFGGLMVVGFTVWTIMSFIAAQPL